MKYKDIATIGMKKRNKAMKRFRLFFISSLFAGACALNANAGFSSGTDSDGNFYFSQRMAEWCSLNFDSEITEKVMQECLAKIAGDYHAKRDEDAYKARIRFRKMKMESVINAFITAHEAKKKFANDKEEEKADKINTDSADSERTLNSGNAETMKKIMDQENWLTLLQLSIAELDNLDTIEDNGEIFVKKDEDKQ